MSLLKRFQEKLSANGADAALISSELNQRYISGFNYTDGYILVLPSKACLLADFRYIEAAQTSPAASEFEIIQPENGMTAGIYSLLTENNVKTLLIEDATLSCAAYSAFAQKFKGVTLLAGASSIIEALRAVKDADELDKIAAAQKITDMAFEHIINFISPNMTEKEVALELEFFMRTHGAESAAFDTIAISGQSSSMPHGVPRDKKLEKGFLTMDFGAKVDGYCSDMTRTVVIGRADADMRRLYNTVLTAQNAALDAMKCGISCRELDAIARGIIDSAGYAGCFGHSLGHGVGMFIHENPRLSPSASENSVLLPGHVVTVEPGIYIAGKYGCRIEDLTAIAPDSSVINFTHSRKELIELC